MFQRSFKGVYRKFQVCFQEFQRVLQGIYKSVSRKFQGSFKSVSIKFQGYFKRVSRVHILIKLQGISRKIERYFKGVSVVSRVFERSKGEFQRSLKDVLSFKGVLRNIEVCSERYSMLYQGRFKEVSMVFIDSVKCGTRKFHKSFKSV